MQASTSAQKRQGPGKAQQETYTAALPATGYARLPVVAAVCGIAKSTVWDWAAKGIMPKPVKLSHRVTVWPVAELRAWLADPVAWQAAHSA